MSLIEPLPIKIFRLAQTHWRKVAIGIFLLLFAIFAVVTFRSCGKKEIKIDHDAIDKVNSAKKAEAKAEVKEMVEDNLDRLKTVDGRTELSNVNVFEQGREIDAKIADVAAKVEAAKEIKGNVTEAELKCILIPENCQ